MGKASIIHRICGNQIGWYLRDKPRDPDLAIASDIEFMDGTNPTTGEQYTMTCPGCGALIRSLMELERQFGDKT